jgi:homoserine/homoserine lactone efflux protein
MGASVNWDTYWLYVLAEAALSLSPGPAVLLVIACALAGGARRAVPATLGILSANAVYFMLSASSLGAVLVAAPLVFLVVKWAGAGYLVLIGIRALVGHASPITVSRPASGPAAAGRVYLSGVTLQLANPKTLIFFVAILPQFVDPRLPVGAQMLWLAAGSIGPEFLILLAYGYLASRLANVAADARFARWTDRFAGVLVLVIAALVVSTAS